MNLKRIKSFLFLTLMNLPMKGTSRYRYARLAGVKIPPATKFIYIAKGVVFDSIHPELITIEDHVHIANASVILTHYLDT